MPACLRSRSVLGLLAFGLATALVPSLSGCNECEFQPRCEGNVMVRCGEEDQQFGAKETRAPCTGANPVCVQAGTHLFCATAATPSCTPAASARPLVTRCEGQIQLTCREGTTVTGGPGGYEEALDCTLVHSSTLPAGSYECKSTSTGGSCQPR